MRHLETVKSRFLGDLSEVDEVHQALIDWRPIQGEVIRLRLAGDVAAADAITRGTGARQTELIETKLKGLRKFADGKAREALANTDDIMHESILLIGSVLAGAILLGFAIAVGITRSISRPLVRLDRAVGAVSQGDMTQQVVVHSRDELGRLSSAFNSMIADIREQTEEIENKNAENRTTLAQHPAGANRRQIEERRRAR